MSALLMKWLNTEVKIPVKVTNIERDCSNGWVFAYVLQHASKNSGQTPPSGCKIDTHEFMEDNSTFAKISNFELLYPVLKQLDIPISVKIARQIMTETPGIASKLLFQLKLQLEQVGEPSSSKSAMKSIPKDKATMSLRPPAEGRYIKTGNSQNLHRRFIEHTVEEFRPSETSQMSLAIHLRHFCQQMWTMEKKAIEKEEVEYAKKRQHQQTNRLKRLELFRAQHEESIKKLDKTNWKKNRRKDIDREAEQLRFELTMRERRETIQELQQQESAHDFEHGIANFDRNMKRLGIGGNEATTSDNLKSIQGSALEHLKELEAKVEEYKFDPANNATMMKELSSRREMQIHAQKERERRRRKMLVDQQQTAIEATKKLKEDELLLDLAAQVKARTAAAYSTWRKQKLKAINDQERSLRVEEYREALPSSLDAAFSSTLNTLQEQSHQSVATNQIKLQEARDSKVKKHEMLHQLNYEYSRDIAISLVELAICVIELRQANDREPIHPNVYRELKRKFVNNEPLREQEETMQPADVEAIIINTFLQIDFQASQHIFTSDNPSPSTSYYHDFFQTLRRLPSSLEIPVELAYQSPARELVICVLERHGATTIATRLATVLNLKLLTPEACCDVACEYNGQQQDKKNTAELSPIEMALAESGKKIQQHRDKNTAITDDVLAKVLALQVQLAKEAQESCVVVNFPTTLAQLQLFEKLLYEQQDLEDEALAHQYQQFTTLVAGKPLEEGERTPVGILDWLFIVDENDLEKEESPTDEAEEVNKKAEKGKKHEVSEDGNELWKTNMAAVEEWETHFGSCFKVKKEEWHPPSLETTLLLLVEAIGEQKVYFHDLNRSSRDDLQKELTNRKQSKRQAFSFHDRLCHEAQLHDDQLDLSRIASFISHQASCFHTYVQARQTCFTVWIESLQSISTAYRKLHRHFQSILWSPKEQQQVIAATVAKLNRVISSTTSKASTVVEQKIDSIVDDLELHLGDIAERNKQNALVFLQELQSSALASDQPNFEVYTQIFHQLLQDFQHQFTKYWRQQRQMTCEFATEIEHLTISFDPAPTENPSVNEPSSGFQEIRSRVHQNLQQVPTASIEPDDFHKVQWFNNIITEIDEEYRLKMESLVKVGQCVVKEFQSLREMQLETFDRYIGEYLVDDNTTTTNLTASLRREASATLTHSLEHRHQLQIPEWQSLAINRYKQSDQTHAIPSHFKLNTRQFEYLLSKVLELASQPGLPVVSMIRIDLLHEQWTKVIATHRFPSVWKNSEILLALLCRVMQVPPTSASSTSIPWRYLLNLVLVWSGLIERFPTLPEILEMNRSFETLHGHQEEDNEDEMVECLLTKEEFFRVPLWYHHQQNSREAAVVTEFMFRMYKRQENEIDTKVFLLNWCLHQRKQTTLPITTDVFLPHVPLGFAKAFTIFAQESLTTPWISEKALEKLLAFLSRLSSTALKVDTLLAAIEQVEKCTRENEIGLPELLQVLDRDTVSCLEYRDDLTSFIQGL